MKLVKNTSSSYINMDTIESIYNDIKKDTCGIINVIKCVRCISGEVYDISEEAYNTILEYGKAKI